MTHSRCPLRAAALLLASILAGGVAAKPATKTPPLNIGVASGAGQILLPDPKLPGKFLWKLYVQGGSVMPQSGGYLGRLTGVTAYLYQHGVATARMTAPFASGNNTEQVIVATGPGRILVRSLTQPGTTLEADKMTWYGKKNRIVATGNVICQRGSAGPRVLIPRAPVVADTALKTIVFGKGSGLLP